MTTPSARPSSANVSSYLRMSNPTFRLVQHERDTLAQPPSLVNEREPLLGRLRDGTERMAVLAVAHHGSVREVLPAARIRCGVVVAGEHDVVVVAGLEGVQHREASATDDRKVRAAEPL